MAEEWMRDAVLSALETESVSGAGVTEATLRETTGLGEGDLARTLDELRQEGRVAASAPGEWELVGATDPETAGEVPEAAGEVPEDVPGVPERKEFVLRRPAQRRSVAASVPLAAQEMRMSRAMLMALGDPEAVGRLVLAGVESSSGEFVLRVTP